MKKIKYLVLAFTATIICMMAVGCGKQDKGIDINTCIVYSIDGYSGCGTIECKLDTDKLNIKTDNKIDNYYLVSNEWYKLDKTENLTNGDEVSLKWNIEYIKEVEEDNNVNLSFKDMTIKIENLEEAKKIDFFDGLEITYEGEAPKIFLNYTNEKYPDLSYQFDKKENLCEGDEVTISLNVENMKMYMETYGGLPEYTSKKCTVNNVPKYPEKISDIPEEIINKMDNQLQDGKKANIASGDINLDDIKFLGNYYLHSKTDYHNMLYFVYEITISKEGYGELTYYVWYKYDNIGILEDGSCTVDVMEYSHNPGKYISMGNVEGDIVYLKGKYDFIWLSGFDSFEKLYDGVVTENLGMYTCDTNISK